MNQLKGTIEYSLTLGEGNVWNLKYNQTVENDIAIIAMSQHVVGILKDKLELDKKGIQSGEIKVDGSKGERVKFLSQRIEKLIQTKYGLNLMFDYCIKLYDIYQEDLKRKSDEAANQVVSFLTEADKTEPIDNQPIDTEENITNLSENKD